MIYGFCLLLSYLPLRCLYRLSDLLYLTAYHIVRYRRDVVEENLKSAFPEKSDKERKKIARRFYRFLCDVVFETIKVLHISPREIQRRIRFTTPELLEELHRKNKHIFFATGHYGNWEWLATLKPVNPYRQTTLYKPLKNKSFDNLVNGIRTRFGTEIIPADEAVRAVNRFMGGNEPIVLCFLSDQSPQKNMIQYWTTFLNRDTPVHLGIEKLSRRYNVAVMYLEVRRMKRGYYTVDTTLIAESAAETQPLEITEKHTALLEQSIRRHPEYWLWSHRRWKHQRETSA